MNNVEQINEKVNKIRSTFDPIELLSLCGPIPLVSKPLTLKAPPI